MGGAKNDRSGIKANVDMKSTLSVVLGSSGPRCCDGVENLF